MMNVKSGTMDVFSALVLTDITDNFKQIHETMLLMIIFVRDRY